MKRLLAFLFVIAASFAEAQTGGTRAVGVGAGGGTSTITSGSTPTSGCTEGAVLQSVGDVVQCSNLLIDTKGGSILDPSGARDIVVWRAPYACTVSRVSAYTTGGTSADVNARKNGTDALLAADLTAAAGSWATQTSITNATFAAGDSLEIRLISITGSPTAVAIQVDCGRLS